MVRFSDPDPNSPFARQVTTGISNHKEPIPNFTGVTSPHPSRVRTLLTASTSQMGISTLSSSGDAANSHWQQAALKSHVENGSIEEKVQTLLETTERQAEERGGKWTAGSCCQFTDTLITTLLRSCKLFSAIQKNKQTTTKSQKTKTCPHAK